MMISAECVNIKKVILLFFYDSNFRNFFLSELRDLKVVGNEWKGGLDTLGINK